MKKLLSIILLIGMIALCEDSSAHSYKSKRTVTCHHNPYTWKVDGGAYTYDEFDFRFPIPTDFYVNSNPVILVYNTSFIFITTVGQEFSHCCNLYVNWDLDECKQLVLDSFMRGGYIWYKKLKYLLLRGTINKTFDRIPDIIAGETCNKVKLSKHRVIHKFISDNHAVWLVNVKEKDVEWLEKNIEVSNTIMREDGKIVQEHNYYYTE